MTTILRPHPHLQIHGCVVAEPGLPGFHRNNRRQTSSSKRSRATGTVPRNCAGGRLALGHEAVISISGRSAA
jgi:hypothetical protein